MNRNSARAIERYNLLVSPCWNGWVCGQPTQREAGGPIVHLEPENRHQWNLDVNVSGCSRGHTLDSAVEDWCNARDLPYEQET